MLGNSDVTKSQNVAGETQQPWFQPTPTRAFGREVHASDNVRLHIEHCGEAGA